MMRAIDRLERHERASVASGPSLVRAGRRSSARSKRFFANAPTAPGIVAAPAAWGGSDDPLAVTDPSGRVYGVQGLRVGDASLMPSVPRANTNLPVMMIGEKIAATMLEERG